jgi:hypothetical protein
VRRSGVIATAVVCLVLAGCTSSSPTPAPSNGGVAFTGCDVVACSGSISGAPYQIVLPTTWNGTLLIWSHGYRASQPYPPTFAPVSTVAEPAPGWDGGRDAVGQSLLKQGYALAGSAYASNGWAVADGVAAAEQLHSFFAANIAVPERTYVWGESLGGLVTESIAQANPDWVTAAAPLCGVLAGVVPNFNIGLDVEYAVQQLLAPKFKLVNYANYREALQQFEFASKAVLVAAKDANGSGGATVLAIAGIGGAARQTKTYDAHNRTSAVNAAAETVITGLAFATAARYDVEQRFGGNVSGNVSVNYSTRLSTQVTTLVNSIAAGTSTKVLAALARGQRIGPDAAAVAAAEATGGNPLGDIRLPTLTIHTAADQLVLVQNESFFASRYQQQQAKGKTKGGLTQLFTVAPSTYPQSPGASYGAGHCNFTAGTYTGVISLLDSWVRSGTAPTQVATTAALGTESGFDPTFRPPAWPRPNAIAG